MSDAHQRLSAEGCCRHPVTSVIGGVRNLVLPRESRRDTFILSSQRCCPREAGLLPAVCSGIGGSSRTTESASCFRTVIRFDRQQRPLTLALTPSSVTSKWRFGQLSRLLTVSESANRISCSLLSRSGCGLLRNFSGGFYGSEGEDLRPGSLSVDPLDHLTSDVACQKRERKNR